METVRLLYPDWLIIAIVVFIIILIFAVIIYFGTSIRILQYIDRLECTTPTIYFIKTLDGDNLINIDEIEQVTQGYSRETNQYEIIYYLKSLNNIKETFDNGIECRERFKDISRILNEFNY